MTNYHDDRNPDSQSIVGSVMDLNIDMKARSFGKRAKSDYKDRTEFQARLTREQVASGD